MMLSRALQNVNDLTINSSFVERFIALQNLKLLIPIIYLLCHAEVCTYAFLITNDIFILYYCENE